MIFETFYLIRIFYNVIEYVKYFRKMILEIWLQNSNGAFYAVSQNVANFLRAHPSHPAPKRAMLKMIEL